MTSFYMRALKGAMPPLSNRALLITVLTFCALLTSPIHDAKSANHQLGIQGADDRQIVEEETYPWQSIGRVNFGGRGHCTGVLIGPSEVLTAKHCLEVRNRPLSYPLLSKIHFLAGYKRGVYVATSPARSIRVRSETGVQSTLPNDWAIITLMRPLGSKLGYLSVEPFDAEQWARDRNSGYVYTQAGYSRDRSHVLTRHTDCKIRGFAKKGTLFTHYCDAIQGDSGSPIMAKRGKKFSVIGLHVAASRTKGFGIAIAGAQILKPAEFPKPAPPIPRARPRD